MDDAQQELHQKSLRDVRAYLDREEAEAAQQKETEKGILQVLALLISLVLLAIVAAEIVKGLSGMLDTKGKSACVARVWAEKAAARERTIQAGNPQITPSELGAQLQREDASIRAQAAAECASRAR